MLNFGQLFALQKEVDDHIEMNQLAMKVLDEETIKRKLVLGLMVELGELANETRCFKYWSQKGPSDRPVILEEYVDGLAILMSIGNKSFISTVYPVEYEGRESIEQLLIELISWAPLFQHPYSDIFYCLYMGKYLKLGEMLGFNHSAIEKGYLYKNKINHQRQEDGY